MPRHCSFALIVLSFATTTNGQEARELWRYDTADPIWMHMALPSGGLFTSTSRRASVIEPDSGRVVWSRDDLTCTYIGLPAPPMIDGRRPGCRLNGAANMDASVVGGFLQLQTPERLVLISLSTGQGVFDSAERGLRRVTATCVLPQGVLVAWHERGDRPAQAAAFDLSAGRILWTEALPLSRKVTCVRLWRGDAFLLHGEGAGSGQRLFGIDVATGLARWESNEFQRHSWGKAARVIANTDSTAVLYVNRSGPTSIDLRTGSNRWRTDLYQNSPEGDLWVDQDRAYVTHDSKIAALDLANGEVLWKHERLSGKASILGVTQHGLVVRAGAEAVHMVGHVNGALAWPEPIAMPYYLRLDGDTIFHVRGGVLRAVSLENGSEREVAEVPFARLALPDELRIEVFDGGLFVFAGERFSLIERDGRVRYNRRVPGVGLGLGAQLLRTAAAAALWTAAFQAGATLADFVAMPCVEMWCPDLFTEFGSRAETERFIYRYTDGGGGTAFNLVQIDRQDGSVTGSIGSDERRAKYALVPHAGRVFFQTGPRQITAYVFAAPTVRR